MTALLKHLSIIILPLLFAMTLHESAHAWVANKKGDPTARRLGRISLNPWVHVDLFGTIIIPILLFMVSGGSAMFGWAKPVPVNIQNLRRPKQDMAWVAAAGPAMNLLLALASGLLYRLILLVGDDPHIASGWPRWFLIPILLMLNFSIQFNLLLFFFNLIPIPPLDGGRVLAGLLPVRQSHQLLRIEPYGMLLLLFFFYVDPLGVMPGILGPLIDHFAGIISGNPLR